MASTSSATRVWPVTDAGAARLFDTILAKGLLRPVFQPVVELSTGAVVGYEGLIRGPEGSPLEQPQQLLTFARRFDRLADFDWACRGAILLAALEAGMGTGLQLFVNAEPEVLHAPPPPPLAAVVAAACSDLAVTIECTERALVARPAELLRSVSLLRQLGWGVALDDVGADRHSLALLPLLRPDVIKLDLRLIQDRATVASAQITSAVAAEAERTGALILAEGIETPEHIARARSLGATLGQGWRFGRPGPLPEIMPPPARAARLRVDPVLVGPADSTPFRIAMAERQVRDADKRLLIMVSTNLERQALALGGAAVVLSAFQHARFFNPGIAARYAALADRAAFVAVFGAGMGEEPAPKVRGAVLSPADPVRTEWDVVVLGPHFAGALVARDRGDTGPDADRRFDFVLTYDRDLTVRLASSLLCRTWPDLG